LHHLFASGSDVTMVEEVAVREQVEKQTLPTLHDGFAGAADCFNVIVPRSHRADRACSSQRQHTMKIGPCSSRQYLVNLSTVGVIVLQTKGNQIHGGYGEAECDEESEQACLRRSSAAVGKPQRNAAGSCVDKNSSR